MIERLLDLWPINHPSGPGFLGLYALLCLVGYGLGAALVAWLVRGEQAPPPQKKPRLRVGILPASDDYWAISYLQADAQGLAHSLTCAALAEGAIVKQSSDAFAPGTPSRDPLVDELRREVKDGGSADKLRTAALSVANRHAPDLATALRAAGLERTPEQVARTTLVAWGVSGVLLAVGLARLVRGLALGRPVAFLAIAIVVTGGLGALVLQAVARRRRTSAGDAYLRWLERATVSLRRDVGAGRRTAAHEVALAAAVGGAAALMAAPMFSGLTTFFYPPTPAPSCSSSSCGGGG